MRAELDPAPGIMLREVPWDLYLGLRDLEENNHIRMTYLDGTLVLMSPEYIRERGSGRLALLVRMVAAVCGLEVAGTGKTTLFRQGSGRRTGSGKEPDNGFYVGANEKRIRGKTTMDLKVDPPPDLAIEVDNESDSEIALPAYARIGVPEVWRYDAREHTLWFGRLAGEAYETIESSLCLPMLTPGLVLQALDALEQGGQSESEWLLWLREWAHTLPEPPKP
jgi:Uma2 family endonuclease